MAKRNRMKGNPVINWQACGYGAALVLSVLFNLKLTVGKDGWSLTPLFSWASRSQLPSSEDHDRCALLVKQLEDLKQKSVRVDKLPKELQGNGTADDAMKLINELVQAHYDSFATVDGCIQRLDYGIEGRHLEVNTARSVVGQSVDDCDYVRSLEMCLKVLGKYKGPLDGKRSSLLNAILDYQREIGLKPDGIVGARTWARIKVDMRHTLNMQPSTS